MMKQKSPILVCLLLLFTSTLIAGCSLQDTSAHAQTKAKENKQEPVPVILEPQEGDVVWFFAESKDKLGSGGELQIYLDHETHSEAGASFSKFTLGVGGALPVHKHDKTEEIAYFLSGEGAAIYFEDGIEKEVPVSTGYVWYNPRSAWHSVKNTGDEPLVLVFATIPNEEKGLLSFFRKIGVKPGEEATPLNPEEFGKLASEHDLILKPDTQKK